MSGSATVHSSLWQFSAGDSQYPTERTTVEAPNQQSNQDQNASPPSSPDELPPSPIRENSANNITLDTTSTRSIKVDSSTTSTLTDEQKKETAKLGLMLCNAQIPLDKIEDPHFRAYIQALKPDAYLPDDQQQLNSELRKFYQCTQKNIKEAVKDATKFSILLDILNASDCSVLAGVSLAFWTDEKTNILFLGVKKICAKNPVEANHEVNKVVRKVLRGYSLQVSQALCIIVNGFDEMFGAPFKAATDIPAIRSFQRQLKDIFCKIVKSDPNHLKLVEALNKLVKNLNNYFIPRTQFSNASKLTNKMTFDQTAKCFVQHKHEFLDICTQYQQIDLNLLSETEWSELEELHKLYELFGVYSNVANGESYVTVDQAVPLIFQLIESLEKEFTVLSELAAKVKSQIEEKFAPMLNPKHPAFDPFFVQATALNPTLILLLDEDQQEAAKTYIYSKLMDRCQEIEPPSKKRRLESSGKDENNNVLASNLHNILMKAASMKRRRSLDDSRPYKEIYVEKLVKDYFEDTQNGTSFSPFFNFDENLTDNPMEFWKRVLEKCPELAQLAIETIRLPSSTVAPEIAISIGSIREKPVSQFGFLTNSSEDDADQLERHAIIHYNKRFWPEQNDE